MSINVWIKRVLPSSDSRNAFRVAAYLPADALEFISGKRQTPIPPRGMRFDSAESYAFMGKVGVESLQRFCGLNPCSRVFDAGCGAGRMAVAFAQYLTSGSYDGFDIVPLWIKWCQNNITRQH